MMRQCNESHMYQRTMLTGEEASKVCEELEETDGGGGEGKEGVKKAANEESWKGVQMLLQNYTCPVSFLWCICTYVHCAFV